MTTSRETDGLDHPAIRRLVNAANELPLDHRVTLMKALVPEIARELPPRDFAAMIGELKLKGERFYEALKHPGTGRAERRVMGERDHEGR